MSPYQKGLHTPDVVSEKVKEGAYCYSLKADAARAKAGLSYAQIEEALGDLEMFDYNPDEGKGESCLLVGFSQKTPIHITCAWRGDRVVILDAYIPGPPEFSDPWTRA